MAAAIATRSAITPRGTIPPVFDYFELSIAAWARRIQSGPGGTTMVHTMGRLLEPDGGQLAALAEWTDRIKAGELPASAPPRPVGVERDVVVTVRDWLDPKHYLHDLTATDKRNPTVNANGPLYGVAFPEAQGSLAQPPPWPLSARAQQPTMPVIGRLTIEFTSGGGGPQRAK